MRKITIEILEKFKNYLYYEEKSPLTISKYLADIKKLQDWLAEKELNKSQILAYKAFLSENLAASSVNASLSSINKFFTFMEWYDLKTKSIKTQRKIFSSQENELTKAEYERLLDAAKSKNNERLYLLMQTICSTGIRVSELKFITVEALKRGFSEIYNKGKRRTVFLPDKLCRVLKVYTRQQNITNGAIFVSRNGKPLDRSNIWSDMKKLCKSANVSPKKVFPHNLRHLFARTYYSLQKDIVRLADILGHSSVNTTRIYTMESGEIHRKQIQKLGLLRC